MVVGLAESPDVPAGEATVPRSARSRAVMLSQLPLTGVVALIVLGIAIFVILLVSGFFIPPAAIILMTSPILYPIITTAGFDPVWFGVIMTINMEIGLIHPPVGLNIYIVSSIAPDVPVTRVMWGTIPYVACMMLAIVILCIFPEIATWLPDHLMGAAAGAK